MRVIHHSIVLERKCCFDVEKFGFHRLTSIISLFIFSLVLSGIYNIFCISSDTFAHTASITSSGAVTIDVSASGNQANLGTDNITVNSSCPLGYTVSIAGPADNTLYRNGDSNSNDTISASTGTTSNPVSILGNNLGTWGYSTANNTTISSNFIGLTNTQVPIKNSAGASASGGDSFSVYYGVSVTNNTASGIYTLSESSQGAGDDAIVYYLTPNVNCAGYIIRYNDNGANSNTTMGITHSVIEDDEVTLAASNYKRNGYGFAGWSTVQLNPDSNSFQTDLATAKAAGKVFGPNETITANAALLAQATVENNTQYITMYAIWVKPATNAYLQNWQGCNSMNTGDVIALTDQRDSQAYAVAKLADDNCWMIENLRLESQYTTRSGDAALAQGYGGVFSGLATAETSNFSNSTTANSKYSTTNITGDNQGYRFPRYSNTNTNSTVSSMAVVGSNVYSYGNYYTWAAAMANTNNYTSPTATIDGKTSEDDGTSLCPTGWRLPRGGNKSKESTNDFWALVVTGINNGTNPSNYSSNTAPYFTGDTEGINVSKAIRVYPNNFSLSGYISDSSIYSRGNNGRYWASTASSDSNSYLLALNASNVYPGTSVNNKFYGGSVRCMMDSGYTITINAGNGVTALTAAGWTGSGTGTISKTIREGETIDLSTIVPTYKTGYTGAGYSSTGSGSISGSTYTVGSGAGTITIGATGLNTPTCTIQGGDTKVYNYDSTTLTATSNASNYDTNGVNITYSFGYGSSASNTLGNFSTAQSGNTYTIAKSNANSGNGFYGTRYYGVKVIVTDKTDSSITATCTSGTGSNTGTTVANRTTVARFNARINFNANGGTLSGTSPVYVAYENSATYSSRTATTTRAIPSATPPTNSVFDGWWTDSTNGTQVIDRNGNIKTTISNWTDENGKWILTDTTDSTSVNTLYAHYTSTYTITINAGPGVSTLTASGWSGSGTGTISKSFEAGETIDLSTITPTYKTAYSGITYTKASGSGSINNSTFTVGAGVATITIKATTIGQPTCTISGGDTKVYNYASTTLTAGDVSSDYDTSSTNITYSFGYNTSATNALRNFSTAQTGNTYDVVKNAFRNTRYYGVKIVVTDKTDSSITATCTSGSGAANRTAVYRYNSRVNFNANGGTMSGTSPVYVSYENAATYSGRTNTTAKAIPTITAPSGKRFNGWWTATSGGSQVIDAEGNMKNNVTDWTNDSGQWIRTTTNSSAVAADTLYAQYVNIYTITINAGPGVSALTASGWAGTGTGTLTKEFAEGETIDLSAITPTYKTGYSGAIYSSTGSGSISGSTYTAGSGTGTITIGAGLIPVTCGAVQGGDTKVYNYASTTLTATDVSSSYDTSSADITYSFGYASSATNALGNFSAAQSESSYTIAKSNANSGNGFYGTRYYGVTITVTDKTDNSITTTCTSGTGTTNRATVTRVNARINLNATANGGTLGGTNPVYVAYENSAIYSSRTATTTTSLPTVTPPSGKAFNGWWTTQTTGGAQVIDASGNINTTVANWTNEYGQWILTDTTDSASVNTLYARFVDTYTITINAGTGISSLTASGWTGTGTGTLTKEFAAGETIDLSAITAANKTGYTGSSYSKTSGSGTLSGSTFTVGSGAGTITFKATGLNTPTCTIKGGDTKVFNYASTIVTATDNSSNFDTSSVDIIYEFGYPNASGEPLANYSPGQTGLTYEIAKDAFYGTRYYGVRVTVTDKTDNSITSSCSSATGSSSGNTVNNRTTVNRVNSRVNFNANGGTLSHSNPVYVAYDNSATYSSRTGTTARAIPTVTPASGKRFNGWWTLASGGTQVINESGNLVTSATNWVDGGKWIRTTTNTDAVAGDTLYAQYINVYTITINAGTGISSLTASGWTGTGTGTLTKEFAAGETIDLSTITVADKTGYTGSSYSKTSGSGTLSGSTFTVGSGAGTITFKATGLNTPTCGISGGDTKVYNYAATTLTATNVSSSYDTSSANITYSFGYNTSATNALGNFSAEQTGNTYDVVKDAFYNVRYYGVKITVTDKTDSSITATCTSGTGATNRTAVYRYNSRINFNANGGTLSHSNPVYVAYGKNQTYSSRTATTLRGIPDVTAPAGKKFNGWWTAASGGTEVFNIFWDFAASSIPDWAENGNWARTTTNANAVAGDTLYAQFIDVYTITINAGAGISTLTGSGWTGSGTGTLTKEFAAGETIDLSTITVADKTGYTGSSYSKTSGSGTLSGSTFTVGSGAGTITFKATGLNTPTCKMTGGDTQVYAYVPTTITATDNSSNYDSSSVDITYSFGYASSASGTLVDFSSTQDENTYNVTRGAFRGTRYYGVTVTVTDKTDSSITTTCTSGTGSATGSTVANRTTVTKVNARVNFNANGGSGGGYSYVSYNSVNVYVSRTSGVVSSLPTVTPPSGNAFNGWWTDPTNGTQVIDKDGNIQSSVSGWTNASGQWILTNTTDNNSVNVLYAHYVPTYQIEIIPRVGIASISASGWTVTGTGSLVKEFVEGETIDLSTIIPTYKTGYTGVAYLKATGRGELNGSIFTVGNGLAAIEISATGINTPTCEIKGGDTKVYNYTDTKLTAMDVSSSYDTSSVSIVYEFGYATSLSGALANFTQSSSTPKNEFYVAKNAFRGERIYGVRVTVTDNTDSSITSTCTSMGGLVDSGDSYADRTIMRLYNARINFNPNGGTLSHSNPVYVSYEDSNTYSSRTGFLARNIPTVTPPTGKVFAGWYLAPEQGQPKVIDDDGSLVTVSGWVNESGQWILTSTLDNSNANTLYAQYRDLPCGATGVICYDDNGANSSTTMGNQSVASSATSVNLWASNFQRSGYGFAGWNTKADGSGTKYGPNEALEDSAVLSTVQSLGLKLYAMWVEPAKDSSNNVLTFQTNNLLTVTLNDNSTLDSKPVGYVTALKDARDNQVYAVAKYADGNYWMIENLRLEAAGTTGSTNQALSQGYGGVFTGLANAENANFAEVTTANSKYSTSNVTGDNQAYRIPRYNNVNTQSTVSVMTDPDQNVYSYGNYYNWPAATANTTNTLYPYDSESTGTSICPAGWRLPTGGHKEKIESSGSDYYNLSYILAGAAPTGFNSDNEWLYTDDNLAGEGTNLSRALRVYPYNFVYSGRFDVGSAHDRGAVNNYWSATKHLHGSGSRFAFRDYYVFPATTENFTYRGDSVRCMAGQVLYNNVAKQSKGTQTSANLQANITKSNSGVYEYNSSVFGAATDAANDYKIYYYRGILDNTTGTYGSNGDGAAYPNYVRLGNTCWRIVRTTGSGGTKMIYNGNWTGSTCANATTNAQVGTSAFNGSDDTTSRQWVRVGYTYRSAYASTATNSRTLANTFGTNTSFANNSTSSNIKSYIEGTWFTGANGVSAYQSMLEPSAGYCNDRTVYNNATPAVIQGDSVSVAQYATSATRYNFGALVRNVSTTQIPSLGCPRSTADLYTTADASNGNKQLTRAAALLTADEASFAGSGNRIAAENGSDYDPNSFLNSGSEFLLLSPYYRATTGIANVFEINTNGAMTYISTGTTTTGVRPVISLKPGTATAIGSGTATDPWIIKAP